MDWPDGRIGIAPGCCVQEVDPVQSSSVCWSESTGNVCGQLSDLLCCLWKPYNELPWLKEEISKTWTPPTDTVGRDGGGGGEFILTMKCDSLDLNVCSVCDGFEMGFDRRSWEVMGSYEKSKVFDMTETKQHRTLNFGSQCTEHLLTITSLTNKRTCPHWLLIFLCQ